MEAPKKIIISGAGLVGSLAAIAFKKRGHTVELYEARSDMRNAGANAGKSINLILTRKGIEPLKRLAMLDTVLAITTPVYGRMMHSVEGDLSYQPYGKDDSERNYSVSRAELNILLLNEAEKAGVKIIFDSPLARVDFEKNLAFFGDKEVFFDHLIGADGAGSKTRGEIQKVSPDTENITPLGSGYKELLMPATKDGSYPIDEKALHIWPRGNHFLMALPNQGGSFTMTVYLPDEWMQDLKTPEKIKEYFETYYPDATSFMPNYIEEFLENPDGFLGSLDTYPWVYKDKALLMGDAAHALCPFFGQGMNCGFSDLEYLLTQLDELGDNWTESFSKYQDHQKQNGDAIRDMSLENFIEMSESVGNEEFLLRKKVEHKIENAYPELYRSRYAQVVYTLTPYHIAKANGEVNKKILDELCQGLKSADELDLELAKLIINKYL